MKGTTIMETYTEEIVTYEEFEDERIRYKDSTYDIISKVAYLIGVPKRVFENEYEPPKLGQYRTEKSAIYRQV